MAQTEPEIDLHEIAAKWERIDDKNFKLTAISLKDDGKAVTHAWWERLTIQQTIELVEILWPGCDGNKVIIRQRLPYELDDNDRLISVEFNIFFTLPDEEKIDQKPW